MLLTFALFPIEFYCSQGVKQSYIYNSKVLNSVELGHLVSLCIREVEDVFRHAYAFHLLNIIHAVNVKGKREKWGSGVAKLMAEIDA